MQGKLAALDQVQAVIEFDLQGHADGQRQLSAHHGL
jgi:hypothetical protein